MLLLLLLGGAAVPLSFWKVLLSLLALLGGAVFPLSLCRWCCFPPSSIWVIDAFLPSPSSGGAAVRSLL